MGVPVRVRATERPQPQLEAGDERVPGFGGSGVVLSGRGLESAAPIHALLSGKSAILRGSNPTATAAARRPARCAQSVAGRAVMNRVPGGMGRVSDSLRQRRCCA